MAQDNARFRIENIYSNFLTPLLDARWWEINLGLSFKVEFGKGQLADSKNIFICLTWHSFFTLSTEVKNYILFTGRCCKVYVRLYRYSMNVQCVYV